MRIPKKLLIGVASLLIALGAVVTLSGVGTSILAVGGQNPCTDDQIIRCGVTSTGDLLNKYDANVSDVKNIFSHYDITRSDISGNVANGVVMRNGDVVVNGKVVATGAYSLSRIQYMSNDSGKMPRPVTINGTTYYEGPDMGTFKKGIESVAAYVIMRNGEFHRAVLIECANPVVAVPKPQPKPPVYACNNLTATRIATDREKYRFTATASAKDGASVVDYNYIIKDGTSVETLKNQPASIEREFAKTAAQRTITVTVTANVKIASTGNIVVAEGANCTKTITIPALPKVSYKCESLTATKSINSRTTFTFKAVASAENATIKSYTFDFGDRSTPKVIVTPAKTATTTYSYPDKAANYTAKVTVTMSDGSIAKGDCTTPIVIEEKPVEKKPDIEIIKTVNDQKHISTPVGTQFTYEITVRNTGNVDLKNALVTDNAPAEVTLLSADKGTVNGNKWTYTIPELKAGKNASFTITAVYKKYAGGKHVNKVCVDTPTIPGTNPDDCDEASTETSEKIEVCDLTTNTIIKIERSEFDESTMTTDLSKCEVVETPPELPQTGIDTFISGGLGLGSITAAGYYWSASRRSLLSALLKK